MEETNYPSNSHKSKENRGRDPGKKLEKVIKGSAIIKKSNAQKLADIFVAEDVSNVKSYIIFEVLIPAVKKAISDIVTNGIDMILYGESGRTKKNGASRISYSGYYNNNRQDRVPERLNERFNYDNIVIETRSEAEEVLTRMDELVATYGVISVADFYDLVGVTCEYTDNNYGWTDIRRATIVRVRNGFMIKLPKALPLDH